MDRNVIIGTRGADMDKSLSARRAWIEIKIVFTLQDEGNVALRKESVDRNWGRIEGVPRPNVALRKESVDRNSIALANIRAYIVALRKESVDRNFSSLERYSSPVGRSPQGERG